MPTTKTASNSVISHVKGSMIPDPWAKQIKADPEEIYTITFRVESKYEEDMPSEDSIRPEFIEEIKRSEEDYKQGRYTRCSSDEEIDQFFKQVLDE